MVYIIYLGGYLKIGYTTDMRQRMRALRLGHVRGMVLPLGLTFPAEIEILGVLPGDQKLEHTLQLMFKQYKITGEFFHDNDEIRAFAKGLFPY